ncbi:hypothetical protein [Alkalihalobacillus sp. BA299]|uniref:hypothetical protein n=1 Tax=Alkalihalobacillus sp. BA299 TaxID=2815938 RepID=UPI001ADA978E|nr:hypothetical protein [Alkalihalobacillus sp. BA299]
MKIIVIHTIGDTEGFDRAEEKAFQELQNGSLQLPEGVSLISRAFNHPRTKQVCTWEAPSIEIVEEIVEALVGPYSKNEYYEVEVVNS